jgi:hypothetical protein
MQILKKIGLYIWKKPSAFLFIFLIIFSADRYNRWVNFEKDNFPFVDDVDQFYSYLPAVFIHHDLTFSFPNNYWTVKAKNGTRIARTTYGMALLYSPFFFVGHSIAKAANYKADGYSSPYKWSVHFGTFFYTLIGLWFCRKNLLRFFNEITTFITLLCVFLGTNLFYYTFGWGEMCHSYLFFILSLFIFCVIKWHDSQKLKYLFSYFFLGGFATLIRPTDAIVMLFPLMIGINSLSMLKERVKYFINLKVKMVAAIAVFVVPLLVQLCYWKVYSGQWFIFTYGAGERFFFNDPQVFNFLFSFRKGWFIYTPIMVFSVIGIIFLRRTARELFYFMTLIFILNVYVLSSWWDWSFGGSFGCRALIQHYAFFALSLASFITVSFRAFQNKKLLNITVKVCMCVIFFLLIRLNYNQSWLYKYAIIHPSGMTREAYFYIMQQKDFGNEEVEYLKSLLRIPNDVEMLRGDRN